MAQDGLREAVAQLRPTGEFSWAWHNYKSMVSTLSSQMGLTRHVEVGAGRVPLLDSQEASDLGVEVTLNDISESELSFAPQDFRRSVCDISGADAADVIGRGQHDLVYSHMVMEHVHDVPTMWRNTYEVLTPGGVGFAFFPTLYAPAFVINKILPDHLSQSVLLKFFPERADTGDHPKFPAVYHYCFGTEEPIVPMLKDLGFRDVVLIPFYGYSYAERIPVLRGIDRAFTQHVRTRDKRRFSSFAYLLAQR